MVENEFEKKVLSLLPIILNARGVRHASLHATRHQYPMYAEPDSDWLQILQKFCRDVQQTVIITVSGIASVAC